MPQEALRVMQQVGNAGPQEPRPMAFGRPQWNNAHKSDLTASMAAHPGRSDGLLHQEAAVHRSFHTGTNVTVCGPLVE